MERKRKKKTNQTHQKSKYLFKLRMLFNSEKCFQEDRWLSYNLQGDTVGRQNVKTPN